MNSHSPADKPQSPVRRLGILYLISHCAIALLLGVGEVILMLDLGWRQAAIRSISQTARQERPLDDSLSQSVLSILASPDSSARRQHIDALQKRIDTERGSRPETLRREPAAAGQTGADAGTNGLTRQASMHNERRGCRGRVARLDELGAAGLRRRPTSRRHSSRPCSPQEAAYRRVIAESVFQFESDSVLQVERHRVDRIRAVRGRDDCASAGRDLRLSARR